MAAVENEGNCTNESQAKSQKISKKDIIEKGERLRVVVFDDGYQIHCRRLPFSRVKDEYVIYKEADDAQDMSKEEQETYRHIVGWNEPEWDHTNRWIHCLHDLRKETVYLDLDSDYGDHTYGKVELEGREGARLFQKCDDGTTLVYSLFYEEPPEEYGEFAPGTSWFCLHKIKMPMNRLKRGVSSWRI